MAPVLGPGSTVLEGADESSLSAFGSGAGGAMVGRIYAFALVAVVVCALMRDAKVPVLLVEPMQAIPVQNTRADGASARVVESMVTSAAHSSVNRSMDLGC